MCILQIGELAGTWHGTTNADSIEPKHKKALHFRRAFGADTRIRTGDLILTKAVGHLSYSA